MYMLGARWKDALHAFVASARCTERARATLPLLQLANGPTQTANTNPLVPNRQLLCALGCCQAPSMLRACCRSSGGMGPAGTLDGAAPVTGTPHHAPRCSYPSPPRRRCGSHSPGACPAPTAPIRASGISLSRPRPSRHSNPICCTGYVPAAVTPARCPAPTHAFLSHAPGPTTTAEDR